MASPDRSKRKILKAKKTMPTSCRKQVEILNKSKNVEALKTTATRNNVLSSNQNFGTSVISSKCRNSENVSSSSDTCKNSVFSQKSKVFSQSLIQPMEETVDSEIRFEYINEQVVCPCQKPSKTDSPKKVFIQGTKDSRITSRNTSENHSKYQANITRSFFDHEGNYDLKSICCPHLVLSDVVQMPKSTVTNTLDDKRIDKVISHLETNSNTESHDKRQSDLILSSDSHFVPVEETPKLVNSVSSSNCTTDLKIEDSNRICHSSILNCKSRDSTWQSSLDADSSNSHNQKKRMFSENKENVKRVKTSEQINENICVALEKQTALLEQIVEKNKLDSVIDLTKEDLSSYNTEPPPALSELVDKVRDTLPPQKPELKVKRVLRPKGIALTWNITKINPKCAPVESYHLFLCHENSSNTLIWKKIGEIKALPLPMACTVSQFLTSNKYYFTVQSKDIFGRYGPFCDIKSIPGFSENVT
ncbi:Activating transcription factor 7-interacting protein 2 [Tupaia chinensis]|uniref:Activating transcription factor 7-interacting protein 2 n=1 Tax=Tupaia chinensis TaxID=246437 RepID=L9KYR9_TUPCH|nr:Activating transcription factor 7-interacting protein 2 [Tupaia chinensis]